MIFSLILFARFDEGSPHGDKIDFSFLEWFGQGRLDVINNVRLRVKGFQIPVPLTKLTYSVKMLRIYED